jgi:hypothetical protein
MERENLDYQATPHAERVRLHLRLVHVTACRGASERTMTTVVEDW